MSDFDASLDGMSEKDALLAERKANKERDERFAKAAIGGGVSIGDAIAEALPSLIEAGSRIMAERAEFKKKIEPLYKEAKNSYCQIHPQQKLGKDWEASFGASWQADKFILKSKPCPVCLVNENKKKWIARGVPERVAHATFENYEILDAGQQIALDKFKERLNLRTGFIVAIGECGNGKSHLLASLLKAIGSGYMVMEGELITKLRGTYGREGGKEAMIEKYRSAKCFILDEIDAKVKGDDIQPFLYEILAYRYDKGLITGLGSNEDLDTLMEILGQRLEDRIAANYSLTKFRWTSYRRQDVSS